MIVEQDFLDHWKTRLLVRLLGTELAPIYVLRLWAHCQSRKTDRFTDWKPDVLASVCRWDGDAQILWDAMIKTFARLESGAFIAHDWAECNASLISAWTNGKLGGRPKKEPSGNQSDNRPDNPSETDRVTDREDRTDRRDREDTKAPKSPWEIAYGIELPESLRTQECLEAAKLWMNYKKERRELYKQTSLGIALKKWAKDYTAQTFPRAVEQSISQNWAGLFPLRDNNWTQQLDLSKPKRPPGKEWMDDPNDWRHAL